MLRRLKKEVRELIRLIQITFVMFKYRIPFLFLINNDAVQLRKAMEDLGATFVKLGQLMSLRPDLIPHGYCDEFRKLQDNVKPFPTSIAKQIISEELNKPFSSIFEKFYEKPVASASFGQVYKAVLKNKKIVAVKVQRPNLKQVVYTDIAILYNIAKLASLKLDKDIVNPSEIVKEFERYTTSELNYKKEADNIKIFHDLFKHDKKVIIPKAYPDLCTSKVLTMDFIEGKELNKLSKKDFSRLGKKRILKLVLYAVFKQLFEFGTFHADPHPGNILIIERNKIAFLDFGIIGKQDADLRRYAAEAFTGLISQDTDLLADSLVGLGIASDDIDTCQLKKDISESFGKYYGVKLSDINISEVTTKLIEVAKRNKIRLQPDFVLLGKSIITLEGMGQEIDPNFNFVTFSKPYLRKLNRQKGKFIFDNMFSSFMKVDSIGRVGDKIMKFLSVLETGKIRIEHTHNEVEELSNSLKYSGQILSLGIIVGALLISSTMLLATFNEPKLFNIGVLPLGGYIIALLLLLKLMGMKK